MFVQPSYSNNKTRVSLHDIVREPPEPTAPVVRKKLPSNERQQTFQRIVEESKRLETIRKEQFKEKYSSRKGQPPSSPPRGVVFSTEKDKVGLQAKEVTVEDIMEKVGRIKDQIVMRKRAMSNQKLSKSVVRPIGVVDCCQQALDSSAGFGKFSTIRQVEQQSREEVNKNKIQIRPLTRQKSASARVIQHPKNALDRAVNFLIKEIDGKGSVQQSAEVACKVYQNIKGSEPSTHIQNKIKTIFVPKKTPQKQRKSSQSPPRDGAACNGGSIVVTKFEPLGSSNKPSPLRHTPQPTSHKYEIPFDENTERKQRFLKKGSNITGMILQHIFKGEHRDEVANINFEKEQFVEEYNQTLPEQLSRWKTDIQRSLALLKGKFPRKTSPTKPNKYGGFDMDDVIYLSDNKRLFFKRDLNDYYEESEPATSPHAT